MSTKEDSRKYYERHKALIRLRDKHRRRDDVGRAIFEDARKADRKAMRANDLDLEFVRGLIVEPCRYCGDDELRKTIDRVDNELGHLRRNVVPACERCNYVRRNMPHAAWLVVAEAMREARIKRLFGSWTGGIHRRGPLEPLPPPREPKPHGTFARYKMCGPPTCAACRAAMARWKRKRRRLNGS
jgi:hypothetical protein